MFPSIPLIFFRRSADVSTNGTETALTKKDLGQGAELKLNRPALLVSSTSWTEDEDFGLLFDALKLYDATARRAPTLHPRILLVVTGIVFLRKINTTQCPEPHLNHYYHNKFFLIFPKIFFKIF